MFKSQKGGYLRHSNFMTRVFSPALVKANIRHITFHELRDTATSQAIASSADVLVISQIAGHANPSITLNVFGHVLKDSTGSIRRALDESYADMNYGSPSATQHLSSASSPKVGRSLEKKSRPISRILTSC